VDYDWDDEKVILRNMEFLLKKLPPSSDDLLFVGFLTRTIPVMNTDISSWANRRLNVCYSSPHTERDDVVRLISAREVTSAERRAYEEG
jgi:hypothetical protein